MERLSELLKLFFAMCAPPESEMVHGEVHMF